ncbi:Eukaryotic translation initiation factor 3 subunit 2 [Giardia duodenalis]|uniref:Serine-threonine kinase receptor-associated protein n=1 Tax=Giardia intestinalis (strain ATCC 50803 / WB clone C6) TaxID=184922 RepID=A8BRM0_GIAIC|nr:Eukaryotic translation initiation factor 3 subunit 2 [Giardia intestinalis]KAE8305980.1 Eukaryotic translation initiation factor 3 subunit 2 [Giardia intestinalis]|eukprot:XP_001705299.1 Eukaryotic translation initiation factor 3 subunit 2 [Giardia lamblia ATCC 50803]
MGKVANVYTAHVFSLHGHTRPITKLRYTPDGDYIITGSTDGYTHMWTSTNGQFVQTFGPIGSEGDPGTIASDQGIAVSDFTVSSDGEYVAVSHVLDFIALYKVTSDRAYIRTYKFPEITAYSAIQYSRDGRRLFVGGRLIMKSKAGILVLDASDPKDVKCTKIKCMSEDVTCIALSPLDDYLVVGFASGVVQLFDAETLEPYSKMKDPIVVGNGQIMSIQLYNNSMFTICCSDKKIVILGAKTLTVLKKVSTEYPVHCCAIHPNIPNLMVYAGGMDSKIVTQTTHIENTFKLFFIDIAQDVKLGSIQAHVGPVHDLAFNPNGEDLVSCSEDSTTFLIKVGKDFKNYNFIK